MKGLVLKIELEDGALAIDVRTLAEKSDIGAGDVSLVVSDSPLLHLHLPVEPKEPTVPGWTPETDNPAAELLSKFGPILARVTNEGHDDALHAALALVESVIGRELGEWGLRP